MRFVDHPRPRISCPRGLEQTQVSSHVATGPQDRGIVLDLPRHQYDRTAPRRAWSHTFADIVLGDTGPDDRLTQQRRPSIVAGSGSRSCDQLFQIGRRRWIEIDALPIEDQ